VITKDSIVDYKVFNPKMALIISKLNTPLPRMGLFFRNVFHPYSHLLTYISRIHNDPTPKRIRWIYLGIHLTPPMLFEFIIVLQFYLVHFMFAFET
jgi:hypothetical protein